MQQFDEVVPAQSGHDVRVGVIDDTYHSNVDNNDETCDEGDIQKEQKEASNQAILDDSKLDSYCDQMACEQSKEVFKQLDEEADNHLDCEQNWHTVKSDIACYKGDRTNRRYA